MPSYRQTTATNTRNFLYKYYKVNEFRSIAVKAGRCFKCRKITDNYCITCHRYICENHIFQKAEDRFCQDCRPVNSRELTKKEKRVFRKAEL
jgi:hypothetical protein